MPVSSAHSRRHRRRQIVARINDLTAHPGVRDGALQPVLLDWIRLNAPPLNLLIRRAVARQPRRRTWVDFLADEVEQMTAHRLPAGLPPIQPSRRAEWFKRAWASVVTHPLKWSLPR